MTMQLFTKLQTFLSACLDVKLQQSIVTDLEAHVLDLFHTIVNIEEFIERFPEVKEVMIDGTERPIQRPDEQERQKQHYSGKKKRHTRKQGKLNENRED